MEENKENKQKEEIKEETKTVENKTEEVKDEKKKTENKTEEIKEKVENKGRIIHIGKEVFYSDKSEEKKQKYCNNFTFNYSYLCGFSFALCLCYYTGDKV